MTAMNNRVGWISLAVVGVIGMIAAFVTIVVYPIPDIPSGWCSSGERPGGPYEVQSVTKTALYLDIVLHDRDGGYLVGSANIATGRISEI